MSTVTAAVTGTARSELLAWQMKDWCRWCRCREGIVSVLMTSLEASLTSPRTSLCPAHHVSFGGGRPVGEGKGKED
ncbi:hypothetical protein E2C01_038767 [Portunus trituberculatus]|uniref:Uncharacterized protein n=1 Tax=Portunus trituberculatus TaxID=210409 RepID=A0A5B7FIX2_PORTR|nr:hypothetical protein [Portunus trituberculatus]